MFKDTKAYSGFSVNDLAAAKSFYQDTLGIPIKENPMGLILEISGSNGVFVYEKADHQPATYTILNFPVENIETAVDELKAKGVHFEHYDNMTDEKDIARGISQKRGPDIAWFTDPAGNVLSMLQEG
ncbi:MAG TPA: VOC family protein [Candidatus Saccharimonadales bacterium]|nr:VOC family protein [Candidatus Saccharimonadales bacterium]